MIQEKNSNRKYD